MKNECKTKVAFFVENLKRDYDGAVRTMYSIIDRIPEDEFSFLFITAVAPEKSFRHEVVVVPSMGLPVNVDYKMAMPFFMRSTLRSELDRFAPDIVHIATPSPLGHFGLSYAERSGLPVMTIYHTHYLSYLDYYLADWPKLLPSARAHLICLLRDFYNRCDCVYVPTQEMEDQLAEIGVYKSTMHRWKRGLTPNMFSPHKRDDQLMRELTHNNRPNLLYASRLVWEKNLKVLVEIYQELELRHFPYNLIIAGTGYAESELKEAIPMAIFLGHQSHESLSVLYASADVFVFPSISETYGNVVPEAMASGLPCVIANGGGTREFIGHGKNGFLCAPNYAPSYLKYIDKLINNKRLKERIISKGLKSTQGLCWDALASEYFDDLKRLIGMNLKYSA